LSILTALNHVCDYIGLISVAEGSSNGFILHV